MFFLCSRRRLFFGLVAVCWSLGVIVPPLYAGGEKDRDLSRADQLIGEKQYDEAIRILSEYARKRPEDFEKAQQRLQKIVKIRNEYNDVADELLDEVANEGDPERILALTQRLEELESAQNPSVQAFITRTRELAQFTYNRRRLERILNEGRTFIAQSRYQEALEVYAGGLDIYRDEFFAAGYGELVENQVRRNLELITSGLNSFPAIRGSLDPAVSELVQAARRDSPAAAAGEIYGRLVPGLDRLILFQGNLYSAGKYFDDELARLQAADDTLGDRSFLSFASRLLHGPAGESEGMIGAAEAYWNSVMAQAEESVGGLADRSYAAAYGQLQNREYAAADASLQNTATYSDYPLALIRKNYELRQDQEPEIVYLFGEPVLRENVPDFLKYYSMNDAIEYLEGGLDLSRRFDSLPGRNSSLLEDWQAGRAGPDAALGQEDQYRVSFNSFGEEVDTLLAEVSAEAEELGNYLDEQGELSGREEDALVFINNARAFITGLRTQVFNEEYGAAVRRYTIANGEFEKRLAARENEFEEGNRFIQGIAKDAEGNIMSYYPAEGLAIFSAMEQSVAADIETGSALLGLYEGEPPEIIRRQEAAVLYDDMRSMMDRMDFFRIQGETLAASARTRVAQAETYRQDADRLFREAQAALVQNNFDVARDRLQRAADRYHASLAIQDSAALQTEWDNRLFALDAEINRIENEIVVREVREMVTTARTRYYAGDFERAEELLVNAQNRWRRTNVGDDPEVRYWLNLVRNALSLRSGRTIPPTAPLYAEMSQLLSDARKNYDEGVKFINANRRAEGIARFTEARQKTQEVKLMFPVNQEAGILELRMDQVTDPRVFEEGFSRRFNEAVAGTKPPRRSMESLADLQNLAVINPRYPGMQAALTQAEIDIGLRPPPPDPRALARSNELTAAARRIIEENVSSQYDVALQQLNEALSLNPENAPAMRLKDQVQTRMSGTGVIVLTREAQEQYQIAVRELQEGRPLIAMSIVQQLLQDPRNRSSTLILELQRRIQTAL
jgi:hypothetical protein